MDEKSFFSAADEVLHLVSSYHTNIAERRTVGPDVKPGFIHDLVPDEPPQNPEPWEKVYEDIDKVVVKGVSRGT